MTPAVAATPTAPCADREQILPGHQFADAFCIPVPPGIDAIAATRIAFARVPRWIRGLMNLRNRLVALVGLKSAPASGFPVIRQSADEVVLGFDDRHLDFRLVIHVDNNVATLTTVVRWHNAWGRAYLHAILPFHRRIVPRMLQSLA